jgi:hypothetical protein
MTIAVRKHPIGASEGATEWQLKKQHLVQDVFGV